MFGISPGKRKYDPENPGRVVLEELHNHGRGLNQRLLIKKTCSSKRLAFPKEACRSEKALSVRQDLLIARTGLNIRPASNHL
jgi:hypothetical protein